MFHIGQKVECVDDDFTPGFEGDHGETLHPNRLPSKGGIYEVSGISPAGDDQIMLAEFSEIECGQRSAVSFNPGRFRPLINFTTGASRSSRKWDNRRKIKVKVGHGT